MRVDDPNKIVCGSGLAAVELTEDNTIKIILKNKTSLEIVPTVEDGVISYKFDLMSSEENRKVEKMLEKIRQMEEEIKKTKEQGLTKNNDDNEDNNEEDNEEDNEQENEEENEEE